MPKCNLAIKKYTRRGQTKYKFQVYLSFLVCSQWSRPFILPSEAHISPYSVPASLVGGLSPGLHPGCPQMIEIRLVATLLQEW